MRTTGIKAALPLTPSLTEINDVARFRTPGFAVDRSRGGRRCELSDSGVGQVGGDLVELRDGDAHTVDRCGLACGGNLMTVDAGRDDGGEDQSEAADHGAEPTGISSRRKLTRNDAGSSF